jgi:hypothetical protein
MADGTWQMAEPVSSLANFPFAIAICHLPFAICHD